MSKALMFRKAGSAFLMIALAVQALGGCTTKSKAPEDPKRQLQDYISLSFAVKSVSDRAALLEFLGGEAKTRLGAWSDEQFQNAFIDSKRQFLNLAFREVKPVSADLVNITYELSYMDKERGPKAKITNRKMAQMVRENGKWLIADVRNIKELVEYQNEMSLP